jgi:hypothetical protein
MFRPEVSVSVDFHNHPQRHGGVKNPEISFREFAIDAEKGEFFHFLLIILNMPDLIKNF